MSSSVSFRKMNGLGNDFAVFDARQQPLVFSPSGIVQLASRKTGIGFDQLIVIEPSGSGADAFMRIYNADGSEVDACGNASRCVGHILLEETGENGALLDTNAGLLQVKRADGNFRVSVDMGEPKLTWQDIPLSEPFADTRTIELQVGPVDAPLIHSPSVVSMGNPHCIFFVDDLDVVDLEKVGPMLEYHPLFPQRANISLAKVIDKGHIHLRVWERGAGLTKACGTAACATAVAAVRRKMCHRQVVISLPGGDLHIEWRASDNHVIMTGQVDYEYDGQVADTLLAGGAA